MSITVSFHPESDPVLREQPGCCVVMYESRGHAGYADLDIFLNTRAQAHALMTAAAAALASLPDDGEPDPVPDDGSYEGPVFITADATPPKPPYGTPERAAWDKAHPVTVPDDGGHGQEWGAAEFDAPEPAKAVPRSPVRDADDMFDAAFGTRPGGTARTS